MKFLTIVLLVLSYKSMQTVTAMQQQSINENDTSLVFAAGNEKAQNPVQQKLPVQFKGGTQQLFESG